MGCTNNYLCGWYGQKHAGPSAESICRRMQKQPYAGNVSWYSNKCLHVSTNGGGWMGQGNIDVALIGLPYWRNAGFLQRSTQHDLAHEIAQTYLDKGLQFLDLLAGRFALILYDHAKDKILLCLDRIGQQQIYYTVSDGVLIFSTHLAPILAYPDVKRNISHQGIYNYFYYHAIPSPGTVYEGINKLENGQYLEFSNGVIKVNHYWQPIFSEERESSMGQLSEEMLAIIERSLRRSLSQSTDPKIVGAFLSGGLDSSTVAGILSKVTHGHAKTFSIGFEQEGYDEMAYARIASEHFSTKQHEYYVTPGDIVSEVVNIARYLDEPFGNSSVIPAYFCAKMAQDHGVTTMLAGDGGDELFAGNERYAKQALFEYYNLIPESLRRYIIEPVFLRNSAAKNIPGIQKLNSYISQAKMPLPDRLETYNYLQRHAASELFSENFLSSVDQHQPLAILNEVYRYPESASILNRMLWLDWKRTLHDNDLVKVNRMCEMAGVNVIYPLLDDELVEFSCGIPSNIKIKGKNLRWFYKQAVSGLLPREIINKHKHGFGLPFGMWARENADLHELMFQSLTALKKRDIFSNDFIDQAIRMHENIHAKYYGELLWLFMMLEMWLSKEVPG